jgi:signal transduction histidine kinase/DNA-binding response OmpR family regulator
MLSRESQGQLDGEESDARQRRGAPPFDMIRVLVIAKEGGEADRIVQSLRELPGIALEALHVTSLSDARSHLRETLFDAIVLGLESADPSGLDDLHRLLERASAPVLVFTDSDRPELYSAAIEAGAAECIGKGDSPLTILSRALLQRVRGYHSEQRKAEVHKLLDALSDAVVVMTPEGIVRFCNDAALELLGRTRGELIGQPLGLPVKSEAKSVEVELVVRGARRSAEMSLSNIDWYGEPALAAAIRDTTERRATEAQLLAADRMASLGTLAASVGHEINNPLAALVVNLDLAQQVLSEISAEPATRDLYEVLSDIREAAERVRVIVRDLRVFTRHDGDEEGSADVRAVLESTLRMAHNQVSHRAGLVAELDEVPPVVGTESRLSQVFLNLLINAAQAIPDGAAAGSQVRVRTRRDPSGMVAVDISDTGIGMSEEVKSRLFTPFFTSKPSGVGTGLGLSICQRIVSSFGGRIEVKTEPGKGSTFTVLLRPGSAIPPQVVGEVTHVTGAIRRGRVLVIDDDRRVVQGLRRAIERGHEVVAANSIDEALAEIQANPEFDVILCDLLLPERSGMELYEALRKDRGGLAARIIFMTGGAFTERSRAFLDAVPNLCLEKPFDAYELRRVIDERVTINARPVRLQRTKAAAGDRSDPNAARKSRPG